MRLFYGLTHTLRIAFQTLRELFQDALQDFTESGWANGFAIGLLMPYSYLLYLLAPHLFGRSHPAQARGEIFTCSNHSRNALELATGTAVYVNAQGRVCCSECNGVATFLGSLLVRRHMVLGGLMGGALHAVAQNRFNLLVIALLSFLGACMAYTCFRQDRRSQSPV